MKHQKDNRYLKLGHQSSMLLLIAVIALICLMQMKHDSILGPIEIYLIAILMGISSILYLLSAYKYGVIFLLPRYGNVHRKTQPFSFWVYVLIHLMLLSCPVFLTVAALRTDMMTSFKGFRYQSGPTLSAPGK